MAVLKALCWAWIFIIRIRFPPGKQWLGSFHYHLMSKIIPYFSLSFKRRLVLNIPDSNQSKAPTKTVGFP